MYIEYKVNAMITTKFKKLRDTRLLTNPVIICIDLTCVPFLFLLEQLWNIYR